MLSFSRLFSPIKIGSLELSNRFVIPPMASNLANEDGTVSKAFIDYWVTRAKGGWGLMIIEFSAVDPLGKIGQRHPGIWDDCFINGLRKLTEAVHNHGAKIAIQISHTGRQTSQRRLAITGARPVSASPIPCPLEGEMPRELSAEEVYEIIEKFGDAAVRACEAGFDIVEIHGAHGYLIAQFMSAYSNKRIDEFGGSFINRMRFPLEIIKNVRKKIGNSVPLLFRISCEERIAGGRTIEETRVIAALLEEASINCIDVSVGVAGSSPFIIAPSAMPPGFLLPYSEAIKRTVSVPVIAVGRINDPFLAENAIATGKADLIAWGRPSFADPELPNKVAAGRIDDICPCIACLQGCMRQFPFPDRPLPNVSVTCLVNPFCGREGELIIKPAKKSKKVIIIGGGPAGLEAGWVAAACGHNVTIYEKQRVLGGQYRIAAIPPFKQDITKAIAYFIHMCQRYKVNFRMGLEATLSNVLSEKPDVVIIATGGEPVIPDIRGVNNPRIVTAIDILEGKKQAGKRVLVVGGGMVGCEVADFLGEHMHYVTIVEMLSEVGADIPPSIKYFLMKRLQDYGVHIMTKTSVVEFLDDGVLVEKAGKKERVTGFDSIILALGTKSVNNQEEQFRGKVSELYIIGDALSPRQAIDAIEEGARVALKI